MSAPPIKVVIVADSTPVRRSIVRALAGEAGMEIIAIAGDPKTALEQMRRQWPQVLVLALETPGADDTSVLRKAIAERPTAVVSHSSLTRQRRPGIGVPPSQLPSAADIVRAVRSAAQAALPARTLPPPLPAADLLRPKNTADVILAAGPTTAGGRSTEPVVAIGTSTGGTQALESVLHQLPTNCPGMVIVQHMPERFTGMLAQRLNEFCQIAVREASNGDRVVPGQALIAPGGKHMMLRRSGTHYLVDVVDGPLVNRHKPSVDVLFRSVARFAGANALGIIMTGMGDDGARGLKEMRDAGGTTIAQDEASCVVFGMPREAIRHGGAAQVISLLQIPAALLAFGRRGAALGVP